MNKLWKKFDALSGECYTNMIQSATDMNVWNEAFEVLVDIIEDGRRNNGNFARELYQVEESIDYKCDLSGWLQDYLDELNMRGQYEQLQKVCEKVISLFQWKEEDPFEYRFLISSALSSQGKIAEALAYCEDWYKTEADHIGAATALIYARTKVADYSGAEEIVEKYITKDTACSEENDIVYTAASLLYKASGNKKAEKQINQAIKQYEKELEAFFSGMEDDLDFELEDDFPFL